MTMVNLSLRPDRAVFVSDSVSYAVDDEGEATQFTPLSICSPKVRVVGDYVLTGRGRVASLDIVAEIVGDIAGTVSEAADFLSRRMLWSTVAAARALELTVAGFDLTEDRCRAWRLIANDGRLRMAEELKPAVYLSPFLPIKHKAVTDAQLLDLARLQHRLGLEGRRSNEPFGGFLTLTEIDRAGIRQATVDVLPGLDDLLADIAAERGRIGYSAEEDAAMAALVERYRADLAAADTRAAA